MSPDQNNPQSSPEDIKKLINQGLHPEGVRPFTAPLDEVEDYLVVPDKIDSIDPVTLNVEFTRFSPEALDSAVDTEQTLSPDVQTQPEVEPKTDDTEPAPSRWNKKNKIRAGIAGVVGAALIGGYGMTKIFGDEDSGQPTQDRPTVSGGPIPGGEALPSVETEPNANDSEIVASVEQYPTAAEAILPLHAKIMEFMNYYGTSENLTSTPLSAEQNAEHEAMLKDVFGSNIDSPELAGYIANLDAGWSEAIGYKTLTQMSIDAGYDSELFTLSAELKDPRIINDNQVEFILDNSANFDKNNVEDNMSPEYAAAIESDLKVTATLEQENGAWYIANWVTQPV